MKFRSLKTKITIALGAVFATALVAVALVNYNSVASAESSGNTGYSQSYRNQLVFSPEEGWNNDPNGLLYVPDADGGTYHMYYQYNWDKFAGGGVGATENVWGHMSWGHAVSNDLVHWDEQPVAIPENSVSDDGKTYGMMFSGSAVFDENNTSGFFETDLSTGKVVSGHGIVAVLTQPCEAEGGQRQILAYSLDNGQSFNIYGEILGAKDDGGVGDGEFRDPKVFWSERHGKWLMAVGGGSVRMYASENLKDWTYIGQTGYWGECPDISRFTVGGEEKYVLIISPEDKAKSHEYNRTTRAETYYPAEYYVVGELDKNGLFVSDDSIKRLSEGIDCYAFQSFNNSPDGKVYGVSWSASWKTVGEYERFRKSYNGGMTAVCELQLVENSDGYEILRTPVGGYEKLRKDEKNYKGTLEAGKNAFKDINVREADLLIELDFSGSNATFAELNLRASSEEKIIIRYDLNTQTLTLDRSQSSLLAAETPLYMGVYRKNVPLSDGKLSLRILLDRAFISVFANGGRASYFSAVFPSAISDGMKLFSDGNISVDAHIYAVYGVFGEISANDELVLSTNKIDTVLGAVNAVSATSFADGFTPEQVMVSVVEGDANVKVENLNGIIYIAPQQKGYAKIEVKYNGESNFIDVYIYGNGFVSDVSYVSRLGGFSFVCDEGLRFSSLGDAFLFGDVYGNDFTYSACFTPLKEDAQACGMVFGLSENLTDYWVVSADLKFGKVKLWRSGVGDLKVANYGFSANKEIEITVTVSGKTVTAFIDGRLVLSHEIYDYKGGNVGLNVYNAEMNINRVTFEKDSAFIGNDEVIKVVNVTDGSFRLSDENFTFENGYLNISEKYLSTLEADTEYTFRVVTTQNDLNVTIKTSFVSAEILSQKTEYERGEDLIFTVTDGVEINKLEIDGVSTEFICQGNVITVSVENIKNLVSGEHSVKVYTSKGRPSFKFSLAGLEDYREEEIIPISHVFFYIDIAIFSAAIVAYITVTIVKKCKKRKG